MEQQDIRQQLELRIEEYKEQIKDMRFAIESTEGFIAAYKKALLVENRHFDNPTEDEM